MSSQNPHVVREEEGKAYTIREFVTGRPLAADEMLPDEHGVHPVSPLGFLMAGDKVLADRESPEWTVPFRVADTMEEAYLKSYVVEGNYTVMHGNTPAYHVLHMERSGNDLVLTVEGNIPDEETQAFFFRNTTSDDYSLTGIPMTPVTALDATWVNTGSNAVVTMPVGSGVTFNGIVGAGKLDMCVNVAISLVTTKKYICINNPDDTANNGIYLFGSTEEEEFKKVYDYGYAEITVESCSLDLLVSGYTAAMTYLWIMKSDGTFEPILHCDGVSSDYQFNEKRRDPYIKHFDDVSLLDGKPVIRTRNFYGNKWRGPYLSTLPGMCQAITEQGTSTYVYDKHGNALGYPGEWTVPDEWKCSDAEHPSKSIPETIANEGDIFYKLSDCVSLDSYDDVFIYFYNIVKQSKEDTDCYASKGYSDREVADWVRGKMDSVINHARHPESEAGDMTGAGAFTRWFTGCGDVDISGGAGSNRVMVPGFGLGSAEQWKCSTMRTGNAAAEKMPSGKLLTFGYSTNYIDGVNALPMDWPFTSLTSPSLSAENNITLIRDGFTDSGTTYGSLITGEPGSEKVMNRVHVCLHNNFTVADATEGHTASTTVLKKTFINLATPLDTKDGDEFEITVSMPNVNLADAFPDAEHGGADDKNRSGYYAFISQPRAYVVSGTWNFSDTKVSVVSATLAAGAYTLTIDTPFMDKTGNELDGIRVRVKVKPSGFGSKPLECTGTLTDPTTLELEAQEGLVIDTAMYSYTICGAAYVEPNNSTLPEGSEPLGLNAVRSTDGALGDDMGTGVDGTLQMYNRFYTAGDAADRKQVIAGDDKRQVVAAIYPTVTNTFGWELSGRKKLANLDRVMTNVVDDGPGLFSRIAWMNRRILASHQALWTAAGEHIGLSPEDYPLDLDSVVDPDSISDAETSFLATAIQLSPDMQGDDGLANQAAYPVHQAIRAAAMLAEDYRNARVRTQRMILGDEDVFMRTGEKPIGINWSRMFINNDYPVSSQPESLEAQTIRLRNLPPLVSEVGSRDDNMPVSPLLGMSPYTWYDEGEKVVSEYHAGNPYGYREMESTDANREAPCDFVNNIDGRAYCGNNFAMAYMATSPAWLQDDDARSDLLRAVELAAIDVGEKMLYPYVRTDVRRPLWTEPFDAFAKLVSPDNIPVPSVKNYAWDTLYNDDFTSTLKEGMAKWFTGDAYGYYRLLNSYETTSAQSSPVPRVVATTMDTRKEGLTEIAEFLAHYVPSPAADLPMRNWDGYRVQVLKKGTAWPSSPVYLTRMRWYATECSDAVRGRYAADAFIGSDKYDDVNLNRTMLDYNVSNYSSTPYAFGTDFDPARTDTAFPFADGHTAGAVAYIRVYMKFVFSADAGRWYCMDYRQAPVGYLTPLYGAAALEQTIDDVPVWTTSNCSNISWKGATRMLYSDYPPMEINPALVEEVTRPTNSGKNRLSEPDLPVADGGLGLGIPKDKLGTPSAALDGLHANFWSVRKHLRPATGALPGTDIPRYATGYGTTWFWLDNGGAMSDAVLWGEYDYPRKYPVEYYRPDPTDPASDLAHPAEP